MPVAGNIPVDASHAGGGEIGLPPAGAVRSGLHPAGFVIDNPVAHRRRHGTQVGLRKMVLLFGQIVIDRPVGMGEHGVGHRARLERGHILCKQWQRAGSVSKAARRAVRVLHPVMRAERRPVPCGRMRRVDGRGCCRTRWLWGAAVGWGG